MQKVLIRFILFVTFSAAVQAQAYSTISEKILQAYYQMTSLQTPLDLVPAPTSVPKNLSINLLRWNDNTEELPKPLQRYDRFGHFGEWIVLNESSSDCLDIRNRVLIRDSQAPVQMRPQNPCKVGTGAWYDPYTHTTFTNSTEVQIDHVVPLKNAYTSGAWKWDYQARCTYFNYMGFRDHLKPVEAYQNSLKSDKSPDGYMPPNASYKCEYLKTWLSLKLIWKLGMQRAEAQGIKDIIAREKCDVSQFVFKADELREQREVIQKSLGICPTQPPTQSVYKPVVPKSE